MFLTIALTLLVGQARAPGPAKPVPCKTVADCWLNSIGDPIKRPAKQRGKPLPNGDCGANKVWLRHVLTCEDKVCTVKYVGDKC